MGGMGERMGGMDEKVGGPGLNFECLRWEE